MIRLSDTATSSASAVLESARAMRSTSNGGRFAFKVKLAFHLVHPSMAESIEHLMPGASLFAEHFERLPSSGAAMKTRVSDVGGSITLITQNGRHLVTTDAVVGRIELVCKRHLEVTVEMVLLNLDASAAGSFLRLTKNIVDVMWAFVPPQQVDLLDDNPSATGQEDSDRADDDAADDEHDDADNASEEQRAVLRMLDKPSDPLHVVYVEQTQGETTIGGVMTMRPSNGVVKVSNFGAVHELDTNGELRAWRIYSYDARVPVRTLLGQVEARLRVHGVQPSWQHPAMQEFIEERGFNGADGLGVNIENDDVVEGGLIDRLIKNAANAGGAR